MGQELILQASYLQQQSQELQENITLLEKEILDLQNFLDNLSYLEKTKEKSTLASLGKGVFVKASLEDKELLVNVGSGILVKKTPEEAKKVITSQIKKLSEAKINLLASLEQHKQMIYDIIKQIEKTNPDALKHNHQH